MSGANFIGALCWHLSHHNQVGAFLQLVERRDWSGGALHGVGFRRRLAHNENGERLLSSTMIITEPNKFVGGVHDRMPVLLS